MASMPSCFPVAFKRRSNYCRRLPGRELICVEPGVIPRQGVMDAGPAPVVAPRCALCTSGNDISMRCVCLDHELPWCRFAQVDVLGPARWGQRLDITSAPDSGAHCVIMPSANIGARLLAALP